jgi:ankyrin repeat protein
MAAIENKVEIAKSLLLKGANVNATTPFLKTPLHFAAEKDNLEITQLLIEHGADILMLDIDGDTAL